MSCTYSSLILQYILFYSLLSFFPFLRSHYFFALLYFYSCFYFVCRSSSMTLLGFYFITVCRVCITVDHRFFFLFLYLVLSPSLSPSLFLPVSLHLSHSLPYTILRSPVISLYYTILFAFSLIFLSQSSSNELKWKNIPLVVKLPSISSFITEL